MLSFLFRVTLAALACAALCPAEEYVLTLREAVDLALRQNPELMLARFDEQKMFQNIRIAQDPFRLKLATGSGLAYTSGYPLSIEGNPPAILQTRAVDTFYNRPKTYQVAEARQNLRTAAIVTQIKRDDIAYRTASLYLDVERTTQVAQMAQKQIDEFQRIAEAVALRVKEGRELPIESKRAELHVAQAKQNANALEIDRGYQERSLAIVLGYGPDDSVKPSPTERRAPELPGTESEAVDLALRNNKEIQRLQSELVARQYAVKAERAGWQPQIDLVAQWALLSRNNYNQDFFGQRFNRNAGQLGVSIQLPLITGTGTKAAGAQAEIDSNRIRQQIRSTEGQISLDTRRSYEELSKAEAAQEVARLDLAVAREQVSVSMAQMEEGRVTLQAVSNFRTVENEKWIAYYEAQNTRERARLNVLRQTGSILSSLR